MKTKTVVASFLCQWLAFGGIILAQQPTFEAVGTIPGPATTVYADDTHVFVSDGPTLKIYDLSDPSSPKFTGSYTFPQNIYGIKVQDTTAYAAVDFLGLGVLDVSDPSNPTLLSMFETGGQALSVDVSGNTAVVANRLSGLEIVDISQPTVPVSRGAYYTEGYATDVVAIGSMAYVVDRPGGLSIVDLSKTGEPSAESTHSMTERPATITASKLTASAPGANLVGVMSTDALLELFDVSDPTSPMPLITYRHSERPPLGQNIASPRTILNGSLAFITDANPPFLIQAVDFSDVKSPEFVASYDLNGSPSYISISDSFVFLVVKNLNPEEDSPGILILRFKP